MWVTASGAAAARDRQVVPGCADKRGEPIFNDVATFGFPKAPTIVLLEQGYRKAPLYAVAI